MKHLLEIACGHKDTKAECLCRCWSERDKFSLQVLDWITLGQQATCRNYDFAMVIFITSCALFFFGLQLMFQYTQLRCISPLLKQPSLPVCIPVIKLRQSQYRDLLVRCDGSKCSWRASTGSPIHPIHTICILYVGLGCNTSIILCTSLSSQPAASRMVLPEPSIFTSGHLGRSRNQPLGAK